MQRKIFVIKGLSCNNCVEHVHGVLRAVYPESVVTLHPPRATIISDVSVSKDEINELLKDTKYTVQIESIFSIILEKIKKFLPLITMLHLAIAFGVIHMLLFNLSYFWGAHYFMAGYFLLFGGLKVVNWKKFVSSYRAYDSIAKHSKVYANIYPAIEFGIGLFFYFNIFLFWTYIFTSVLMLQKAYSVYKKLQTREEVQCACLGGFFSIPVTWVTFAEDLGMAVMTIWMLSYYF